MKKLLLLLSIMLLGIGGVKVYAEAKTYWDPASAFGANWNAGTKTMSWNKNDNSWYILYTGFTPKVQNNSTEVNLSEIYTKIHVKVSAITGADNLELKIKSKNKEEKTIQLAVGETDVVFADYSDVDFSKVLEITLWGKLSGSNTSGSAVIDEFYLLSNNRYEYQTQKKTVYTYTQGTALSLASVVSGTTLVSIASTDGNIIYGTHDVTGNQIKIKSLADAMDDVHATQVDKATYRYKITEATDDGLTKPDGVETLYCIQSFNGNGELYRGPYWQDGFLDDLGWCTSVNKGDNGAAFFAFTPVAGKTNTYKISSYKKDGTKQSDNYQGKSEWILNVLTETQKQIDVEVLVEVQIEDTEDPGVAAVPDGWKSLINNGKLDEADVTSFRTKNEDGGEIAAVISATGGRKGGSGIEVVTKDNASNEWGTQFFIKSSEPLKEGQKIHIEFDYRAEIPVHAATQVHRKPGDYNANIDGVDFTVNWKHYSNEFTITSGMCRQDGGGDPYMQSFCLNLSENRSTHKFYFDNLVMWKEVDNATITMGEAGTYTFSYGKALDFTGVEGLKAYAITAFDPEKATLTLTQVSKVPANTGLYLEGATGEYTVPIIESASAIAGNMLVASGDGTITQTSGDKTNLVLAKTSKGRGFHPLSSDGNMGTNKAYLQLPTSEFNSIAEASLRFVFEDDEATGIAEVATPIVADGVWYTINGVKLAGEPTEKGIYIFNGKKVAIQ